MKGRRESMAWGHFGVDDVDGRTSKSIDLVSVRVHLEASLRLRGRGDCVLM
jgi:hypothetical protein